MLRSTRLACFLALAAGTALTHWACGSAPSGPSQTAGQTINASAPAAAGPTGPTSSNCVRAASRIFGPDACGPVVRIGPRDLRGAALGEPSPPQSLNAAVISSSAAFQTGNVSLRWSYNPGSNPLATSFFLEAGSGPGLNDLANLDTGNTQTSQFFPNVPRGTYYVRVRSAIGRLLSAPSNEEIVRVCQMPSAPIGFTATPSSDGTKVTLQWTAPVEVTPNDPSYFIIASGTLPTGQPFTYRITNPTSGVLVADLPSPGRYVVRLQAEICGDVVGFPTRDVIFTAQSSAPPSPPPTQNTVGLTAIPQTVRGNVYKQTSADGVLDDCEWDWDLTALSASVSLSSASTGVLTLSTAVSLRPFVGTCSPSSGSYTLNVNLSSVGSFNGTTDVSNFPMSGVKTSVTVSGRLDASTPLRVSFFINPGTARHGAYQGQNELSLYRR
jgi:hypothetical protein